MKVKRLVTLLMSVLLVLSMLAGCGNKAGDETTAVPADKTTVVPDDQTAEASDEPTEEPTPDYSKYMVTEPTKVTMWFNGKANGDFYQALVTKFNESQDLITVEAICIGSYSAIKEQFTATVQAGTGIPSLSSLNFPAVGAYAGSDLLEELTPYFEAYGVDVDEFVDGMIDQVTMPDGGIYAMPHGAAGGAYYFNRTELAKHGLDEFPTTWEDFKAWAKAVYDATGKSAIRFVASEHNTNYNMLLNFGGDLISKDDPTVTALDNENLKARIKELKEMNEAGYIDWSVESSSITQTAFLNGDTMGTNLSSLNYEDLMRGVAEVVEPFEIGMAWNFGDVNRYSTVAGNVFFIPSMLPQQEKNAAFVFLNYMTNQENNFEWCKFSGGILIHESALSDAEKVDQICASYPELGNIYAEVAENYYMKPISNYYETCMSLYVSAVSQIILGFEEFDSCWNNMIEEVNYVLAGN